MGDAVLGADPLQPVGAAPAGGHDGAAGLNDPFGLPVGDHRAAAHGFLKHQVETLVVENQLDAVLLQILLDAKVDLLGFFRAHVADRAVHQLQSRADGAQADVLYPVGIADALHVGVGAELQIDAVGVVDGLLRQLLAHQGGQVAADLIAQGELAVGERSGSREAGGDVAVGLAVHALACFGLGAVALLDAMALLHHGDVPFIAAAQQFQRGKDPRRTRADDQNVRFHRVHGATLTLSIPFSSNSS